MKVELIFFLLSLLYISAVAGESISFVLYNDSHLFFRSGEIGEVGGEKSGTIELINFHSRGGYFELLIASRSRVYLHRTSKSCKIKFSIR